MLISIVMSVYNAEKYLGDSIESVLNQSFKDFEFIVINDGSTDNSLNIIDCYAREDKRIKVVTRENRGLIYSLNEGIALSTGKYIARIDSDDIAYSTRLQKQYEYLEKNKNIGICGTFVNVIGDCSEEYKEKCIGKYNLPLTISNQEQMLLKRGLLCHPTIMFRRELKNTLNIYEDTYRTSEDYYFYLRALKKGINFGMLQEKLLDKREHTMSKSNIERLDNKSFKEWVKIKLEYLNDIVNFNRDIVVWGASNAGGIIKNILKERYTCDIVNYIDKYKSGKIEGINILEINQLNCINNSLIVIASQPGKVEIENYLIELGYKEYKDYVVLA